MSKISFKAEVREINSLPLIALPKNISQKLSSRGLVIVDAKLNGINFQIPLEPDGKKGHWFRIDKKMKLIVGDKVDVEFEPVKEWPEPIIPNDLKKALAEDKESTDLWNDITPLARWDWIRWINATKNPDTRNIRIEKTLSKLKGGKRNACCFNRSMCTEMSVSKNGVLLS